ncbi:MAG: hypothetical protein U1E89_10680 [Burkholderiaceae bacterium]
MTRTHAWTGFGRALLLAGAAMTAATAVRAGDADQWRNLIVQAPALPATVAEARASVAVRRVEQGLIVTPADPAWQQRAQAAQALLAPVAAASARQIQGNLAAMENDPGLARLAKGLEAATADAERAMRRGERPVLRSSDPQVAQLLKDIDRPIDPASLPPIAAYRIESMRMQPSASGLRRQLFEQRRAYARQHAELDAAPALTPNARMTLVQRHQQLAQQQLNEGRALLASAREALAPRVEKMAALAREAEARGASPAERAQAYQWFNGVLRLVDDLATETLEDVGFWAAVEPARAGGGGVSAYVLAAAPDVDLLADGVLTPRVVPYPRGRVWVPAPPPGAGLPPR